MATLSNTLAALDRLPALPTTSVRLVVMLAGDGRNVEFEEIESIVRRDESMAASVLRRANSAAYAMPGRTFSLGESVRRLGTRTLCRIALETQVSGALANAGRAYGLRRGALSQCALGGAIAADTLARRRRVDPELCFVSALLRDIGKLAIDAIAGSEALEQIAYQAKTRPFLEYEREAFGADHAQLGGLLCERWGLPEAITHAVRWHHEPPSQPHQSVTDITHCADTVARWAGLGLGLDGLLYPFDAAARTRLDTTRNELEALVADILSASQPIESDTLHTLGSST